jgi:hypothetical protein
LNISLFNFWIIFLNFIFLYFIHCFFWLLLSNHKYFFNLFSLLLKSYLCWFLLTLCGYNLYFTLFTNWFILNFTLLFFLILHFGCIIFNNNHILLFVFHLMFVLNCWFYRLYLFILIYDYRLLWILFRNFVLYF